MSLSKSMAQHHRISNLLAAISGLEFDNSNTRFEHDSSRVEFVEKLARLRMIPTVETLRKKYPKLLTRKLEEVLKKYGRPKEPLAIDGSVLEILGMYYWQENRAVVYDLNCLLVACQLDLNYESLKEIVAAHEIAHAVTHVGKYDSLVWSNYTDREEHDKREFFAQAYAWFYCKDKPRLASTMKDLSKTQPDVYRLWESFINSSPDEINGILRYEMLESTPAAKNKGVLTNKVPGKKLEYELLLELITYKEQQLRTVMEDAEKTKIVKRKSLNDIKDATHLLSDVVFWDFPGPRMSGFCDPVNLDRGKWLRVEIEFRLENVLRSLEYWIETHGIKVIKD